MNKAPSPYSLWQKVKCNRIFSEWRKVRNSTKRICVWITAFDLFINFLDITVSDELAKFPDDAKLCQVMKTTSDYEELQKKLFKLNQPNGKCSSI